MEANANRMIDAVQEDCHVGGIWEIAQVTAKSHTKMPDSEGWMEAKGKNAKTLKYPMEEMVEAAIAKYKAKKLKDKVEVPANDKQKTKNQFKVLESDSEEAEEECGLCDTMFSCTHAETRKDFKKEIVVQKGGVRKAKCSKPPGLADEECFIGTVQKTSRWRSAGAGEITVDSAAEESVCPKSWGGQFPLKEPARWMRFVNASGGSMNHYGEKVATIRTEKEGDVMSLGFQVSDVSKPLLAVWRIAEKGNKIQFGPEEQDNFIENVKTGKRVMMKRKGGSYVIPAELVVEESGFPRPVTTP
jgi:hypothetical protein